MRNWILRVFVLCFSALILGSLPGCNLFGPTSSVDEISLSNDISGPAQVNFKIADLSGGTRQQSSGLPAGSIRANGSGATVTFRLTLVDPGAISNRILELVKTVTVSEEGVAEVTFQGVPSRAAIGEIVVAGGNISGKTHFHGASDLTSGVNTLEVSPKGSGHHSDIVAGVLRFLMQSPELLAMQMPNLVSRVESVAVAQGTSAGNDIYTDVLSDFILTQIVSAAVGRVIIASDGGKVSCSGAGNWEKTATEIWQSTPESGTGLKAVRILRQGLGDFSYIAWENLARNRSAVTRHKVSDGSVTAYLTIEGRLLSSLQPGNGSFVLGASVGGLPTLICWDGSSESSITTSGISTFQALWAKQFPGIAANAALPFAGVEYIEIEAGKSSSLLCVVRDPEIKTARLFRTGLDGSTPVAITTDSSLGMWSESRDTSAEISWDKIDLEGVTYNLYWGLSESISTQAYEKKIAAVQPPYSHTGLLSGRTYYYLVTWVDSEGVEHDVYKMTSAKPIAAVVPDGFRGMLAGSGWTILSKADGTVWSCGNNSFGACGSGLATTTPALLLRQVARVRDIISIATDKNDSSKARGHTLFLEKDGSLWAVGNNSHGQLGLGHTTNIAVPEKIPGFSNVTAIAAGMNFSLAVKGDGTVWGWGQGDKSQCPGQSVPVQIVGLEGVVAVAAGNYHGLALHRDGTVSGWGSNYWGELGIIDGAEGYASPIKVAGLVDVAAISVNDSASLFLKSDGTVMGAGYNNYGVLGAASSYRLALSRIAGLEGITAISAGNWASLYLKNDGSVWSGSSGSVRKVDELSGSYVAVSAGFVHYLAMTREGAVMAWGYNGQGQLGDGTAIDRSVPAAMLFESPTVPGAPVKVQVLPRSGRNNLEWEGPSATLYRVYWSDTGSVTKNSPFIEVAVPSFLHSNLTDGKTYTYAITLLNAGGESELSSVVQSTPGPNKTVADGEWRNPAIWQQQVVPGENDDAIIEHQITLNTDQTIRNLTVESSGTLTGSYGVLRVRTRLVNKGVITHAGGYSTFTTYIHGAFENYNSFYTERLFVQGADSHLFIHGPDAAALRCPISFEMANATIVAGSDLKFHTCRISFPVSENATGAIDLAGHNLVLSGGADGVAAFRIDNGEIINAGGIKAGSMNYMVVPRVANNSGPIKISGTLPFNGNTIFAGDVSVEADGALTNVYSAEADIRGKLSIESGGSVYYSYYDSSSYAVKIAGDLQISGAFSPSSATFTGSGEHTVTAPESVELTGTFNVEKAGASLRAGGNLKTKSLTVNFPADSSGIFNMNGKTLSLKGGTGTPGITQVTPCLKINNGKITNVAGLIAGEITYVSGIFENTSPITIDGALKVNGALTFVPGIVVNAGASIMGMWETTVNVMGSLTNNGTIHDNTGLDGGIVINVAGNVTQNGIYTPEKTVFTGINVQSLSVGSDKVITGLWVDENSAAGIVAATDIRFDQARFELANVGSPTGQLDMAGYAVNIQGGFYHALGGKHGLWVERGQLTGVQTINVPTAVDSQTVFGGTRFVAYDGSISLAGNLQLASTTYMVGDVTLQSGSSLRNTTSQYLHSLVVLNIDGNFYHSGATITYVDSDTDDSLNINADNYNFPVP